MCAVVYRTDDISKSIRLELDGRVIASQRTTGTLHIEDDGPSLKLYVPKSRKDREICFFTQLPERLVGHWAISDRAAVKVIGDALTASSYALDGILIEHGIPEIPDLRPAEDVECAEEQGDFGIGATIHSPTTITARANESSTELRTSSTFSLAAEAFTAVILSRTITPEEQTTSESLRRLRISARPSANAAVDTVNRSGDSEYKMLLDRIIRAAKENELPPHEPLSSDTSDVTDSTATIADSEIVFGIRAQDIMAHDMKIGAAGELYVCR